MERRTVFCRALMKTSLGKATAELSPLLCPPLTDGGWRISYEGWSRTPPTKQIERTKWVAGVTNRRSVTHVTGLTVCFYTHRSWGPRANQLLLVYNIHITFRTSLPNLAKAPVSANTDRTLMAIEPSTPMSLKLGLMTFEDIMLYPNLL